MKSKKKIDKKILICIVVILFIGICLILLFNNKNEIKQLSCNVIKSDNQNKLETNILVKKIGKDIHINYTGELEFLISNETTKKIMSVYIKKQVTELKEVNEKFATFEEQKDKITYTFDFNMDSLSETKIKNLLGLYSKDMEELKKHFESGGAICEES